LIKYNAILLASVLLLGSFGFGQNAQAVLDDTTAVPQTPPSPSGFDLLIEDPDGIVGIFFTLSPSNVPPINFPFLPLFDCNNNKITSITMSIPPLPQVETLQVSVEDCNFLGSHTFTFLIDEPTGGEETPTLKRTKITNDNFDGIFSFFLDIDDGNGPQPFDTIDTTVSDMTIPVPIPPNVQLTVTEFTPPSKKHSRLL